MEVSGGLYIGEKNRVQNCLTASNLKPDEFFSVAFEKSSRVASYFKPILVQIANSLLLSKKHPEIIDRYKRIKARRDHKKAIIAICRMFLMAIWHVLSDLKPYTPEVFLEQQTCK